MSENAETAVTGFHLTTAILAAITAVGGPEAEAGVLFLESQGIIVGTIAATYAKEHPGLAVGAALVGGALTLAFGGEVALAVVGAAELGVGGAVIARAMISFGLSYGPTALLQAYETLNSHRGTPILVPNLPGSFTLAPVQLPLGQNYISSATIDGQAVSTWWNFPPTMQNAVVQGELDLVFNGQIPVTLYSGAWSQLKYTATSGLLSVTLKNSLTRDTGPVLKFDTTASTVTIQGASGGSFALNNVDELSISALPTGDTAIRVGSQAFNTTSQPQLIIVNTDNIAAVATSNNEILVAAGKADALTAAAANQTLVGLTGDMLIGGSGDSFVAAGGNNLIKIADPTLTAPTIIYFDPTSGYGVIDNAQLRSDLYGTGGGGSLDNYVINFGSLSPSDLTFVGYAKDFRDQFYSDSTGFNLGYVQVKSTGATLVLPAGEVGSSFKNYLGDHSEGFNLPNSMKFIFDNGTIVYSGNQIVSALYDNFQSAPTFVTEAGNSLPSEAPWQPYLNGTAGATTDYDPAPPQYLAALAEFGGAADPLIDGSSGGLTIIGPSNEITTVTYADATSGVTVDLATGVSSETGVADDVLVNVQNVIGSAFGDTLIGNGADNTLIDGAGNDTLISGGGNATLSGGAGNNVLDGTGGVATADYEGAPQAITLNLTTGVAANNGYGGTDTLISISDVLVDGSGDTLVGGPTTTTIVEDGYQDLLRAGSGPTVLEALSGSNTLVGDSGNDTFIVGGGDNTLVGGAGMAVVDYTNISGPVTVDLSTGVAASSGFITNDTLTGITGVVAAGIGDTLIGDASASVLVDSGGGDVLEAGSGPTVLAATGGDSTLIGGTGDDTFVLGSGGNTVEGGTGINTLDYSEAAVGVTVNLTTGIALSAAFTAADTLTSIAAVIGSGFDDTLIGDSGGNVLVGNGTLIDGGGNNTLASLGGVATADYAAAPGAVTVDLNTGIAENGYSGTDTLLGISDVVGSASGSTLIGDGGVSTGSNVLEGGAGNDTLIALGSGSLGFGGGLDTLIGGGGDNVLIGTGTVATADYAGVPGAVTVDLSTGVAENGDGGTDTLLGISDVIGPALGSTLIGDGGVATGSNVLEGGAGNDTLIALGSGASTLSTGTVTLIGGAGNNVLIGTGTDAVADYAGSPGSVTVNLSTGVAESGYGGTDTLTGISSVLASGTGDTLIGGSGTETLTETGTGDFLEAGSGSDALVALGGSNTLVGGSGSDIFVVAGGDNTVIGGTGSDTIDYAGVPGFVTVDLSTGLAENGSGGTDTLIGVSDVIGSALGGTMIAGSGAETFTIGAGDGETVVGNASGPTAISFVDATAGVTVDLNTGSAYSSSFSLADTLSQIAAVIGSSFDDTLIGDGSNVLIGNGTLIDGGGSNTLEGLGGVATADYAGAPGSVTVDLSTGLAKNGYGGTDTLINVSDVIGSSSGSTLIGDGGVTTGANVLEGGVGNDTLIALGSGSSTLSAGAVTLIGGGGDNVLIGTGTTATADYAGASGAVTVDLSTGLAENGDAGTDTLLGISDVIGSAFDDTLIAGSGAEAFTIGAGPGGDTIIGNATGPTTLSFANAPAGVTVNLTTGIASSAAFVGVDTLTSIAAVIGSGFDDTLIGDSGGNVLVGDGTLIDGGGSNTLESLGGVATADYAAALGAVTVDLSTGIAENGYGGTDTLVGISDVIGSASGSTLIGDGGAATGANVLEGGAGNDTLIALGVGSLGFGGGSDTLIGGGGDNALIGTGMVATADYAGSPDAVTADLSTGLAENGYGGTDTLLGISDVIGSAFGSTLIGDGGVATGANVLEGGAGNDTLIALGSGLSTLSTGTVTLIGGGGNNVLVGTGTTATADYAGATGAVTVDLSTGIAENGYGGTDALTGISGVLASGTGDTLIGGSGAESLTEAGTGDLLEAGSGSDVLTALGGGNTLVGGSGSDTFVVAGGGNTVVGGMGSDTLDYADDAGAAVTVDLSAGWAASTGFSGNDVLSGVAEVIAAGTGDTLLGGSGAETLADSGNDDVLVAASGPTVLQETGSGNTLIGGAGDDTFVLGSGGDTVEGGAGSNTLDYSQATASVTVNLSTGIALSAAFTAADTLTTATNVIAIGDDNLLQGGASSDTLSVTTGNDNTLVAGTGNANLSVAGDGNTLSGGAGQADLTVTGDDNTLIAGAGDALLTVAGNDNVLVAGSGNDTLDVIQGNGDTLIGGSGTDTLIGALDRSTVLSFANASAGVTADLSTGIATSSSIGTGSLQNIEDVIGSAFNDTLIGDNGDDTFTLGAGADTVIGNTQGQTTVSYANATTGVVVNLVTGIASGASILGDNLTNVDVVVGSNYADTLIAGSANGVLDGGSGGNDTLVAGTGNDTLIGSTTGDSTVSYANLSTAMIVNLGVGTATDSGGKSDVLENVQNVIGSASGDDTLVGGSGSDTLIGGSGDESFIAGTGSDVFVGGSGNNTASFQYSNSGVTADLGTGTGASATGQDYTFSNIENLTGGVGPDTLIGDSGDNILQAGSGISTLIGGAGDNTLESFNGGIATADYADAPVHVVVDLSNEEAFTNGYGDTDALFGVSNVIASAFGSTLVGDGGFFTGSNVLEGGAGNDTLIALGSGFLVREGGDVTLIGGAGNNLLIGTGAAATADYAGAPSPLKVHLNTGVAQNGYGGTDSLIGISGIIATGPNNTLVGNSGNDTFVITGGGNTVIGGSGINTLDYTNAVAAVTVDLSSGVAASTGFSSNDAISGISELVAAGTGDTLIGATGAETLIDSGNDDMLVAGSGPTVLQATGINETLIGGAGNDTFILGDGGNTITGDGGTNTLDYSQAADDVTVDLATGLAFSSGFSGPDTLSGIEDVIGSSFNDTLIGDSSDNLLIGGYGATLIGSGGNNTLDGGSGNATTGYADAASGVTVDLSYGTAANGYGGTDTLIDILSAIGSAFDSTLIGSGQYGSVLDGGSGDDTLIAVGSGPFASSGGYVTLMGGAGNNLLDGTNAVATADYAGAPAGVTADLSNGLAENGYGGTDTLINISDVIGSAFDSTLIGDGGVASGTNVLEGGVGDDTLIALGSGPSTVANGTVTLIGGPGNNALIGAGTPALADYAGGVPEAVTIDLTAGVATNNGYGGRDTLTAVTNVEASGNRDTLIGGTGTDTLTEDGSGNLLESGTGSNTLEALGGGNTLIGGASDDTLVVANGSNTLIGGTGPTTVDYTNAGYGITVDLSAGYAAGPFFSGNDTLTGVESVVTDGPENTLIGDSGTQTLWSNGGFNDTLIAGSSNELLYSSGDDDTLFGGAGTDTLIGEGGGDLLQASTDSDVLMGSNGDNTLLSSASLDTLVSSGGDSTLVASPGSNYDTLIVSDGDNTLASSGYGDTLIAGTGADTLSTSGYAETLLAGTGDDTLLSTGAHGILLGGSGNDVLISTDDENTLVSGGDNTLLSSGAYDTLVGGSDSATLDASVGSYEDTLIAGDGGNTLLSSGNANTLFGGSGADFLSSTDYNTTLIAGSGDNTLASSGADDTLLGDGGTDTLVASDGSYEDTLIAGDGDNTLLSSGNSNTLVGGSGADFLLSTDVANTLLAGDGENTLVSSATADTLLGGSGTDTLSSTGIGNTLIGGSGTDLISSSGTDTLIAGSGTDTLIGSGYDPSTEIANYYQFGSSAGQATVVNGSSSTSDPTNELDFTDGLSDEDLWMFQSGNNLQIDLLGTTRNIAISNWFASSQNQLKEITAAGLKLDSQVSQLVQAMATYSSDNPDFDPTIATSMPSDSTLQNAIASAWHA